MSKVLGIGYSLLVDIAGGTSYVAIGQITDLDGPKMTCKQVDVSGFDDHESFLPGMVNYGVFSFSLGWDAGSANSTQLTTLLINRQIAHWKLLWPDNTTSQTFFGFIVDHAPSLGKGEYTKAKIDIQLTSSAY